MSYTPVASSVLLDTEVPLIFDLVENQRFGVEYQPIVNIRTGEIMAFEALARFYTAAGEMISTEKVFDVLHRDRELLAKTERELKKLQLEYAPTDAGLFLNIDPHAVDCNADHPCELMTTVMSRGDVVVELIENSDIHEARMAMRIHDVLKEKGIKTAMDDIGADHALLSLEILTLVDYLKLDRSWQHKLVQSRYEKLFRSILAFSSVTEKSIVVEGIETDAQFEMAASYDIPYAQGFRFRKLFKRVKP